ncbi:MAG: T9SS type A sorting domain-containing protein [Candidatus Kapaibacteriota bacterium]
MKLFTAPKFSTNAKWRRMFFTNFCTFSLLLLLLAYPLLGELPVKDDNNDILWQTVIGDMSDTLWMRGSTGAPHISVTFHPSSKYVAGATGSVEIFSVPEGNRVKSYPGGSGNSRLHFFKNGRLLAYYWQNDKPPYNVELRIVDFETDSIVFRRSGSPPFTISPDERTIAIGSYSYVYLYDIETGQLLRTSPNIDPTIYNKSVEYMSFISQGKEIFVSLRIYGKSSVPPPFYIWNLETDKVTRTDWSLLAVSPDGTKEAYYSFNLPLATLFKILDAETKQEIGNIPADYIPPDGLRIEPTDVAFSPDGRYLLYTFETGDPHPYHIYIWDLERKELVYVMPRKKLGGYSCAFSPDGKYFAIGRSIFLFDFEKIKRKIEAATGVAESQAKEALFVYDSPYQVDYIRVEYRGEKNIKAKVTIYDMYGNVVYEEDCSYKLNHYGEWFIPKRQFSSGVYFLRIHNGTEEITKQFLVVR